MNYYDMTKKIHYLNSLNDEELHQEILKSINVFLYALASSRNQQYYVDYLDLCDGAFLQEHKNKIPLTVFEKAAASKPEYWCYINIDTFLSNTHIDASTKSRHILSHLKTQTFEEVNPQMLDILTKKDWERYVKYVKSNGIYSLNNAEHVDIFLQKWYPVLSEKNWNLSTFTLYESIYMRALELNIFDMITKDLWNCPNNPDFFKKCPDDIKDIFIDVRGATMPYHHMYLLKKGNMDLLRDSTFFNTLIADLQVFLVQDTKDLYRNHFYGYGQDLLEMADCDDMATLLLSDIMPTLHDCIEYRNIDGETYMLLKKFLSILLPDYVLKTFLDQQSYDSLSLNNVAELTLF